MKKPKVVTVASQKGGVGKTTTAITLGHGLALREKECLIVDLDPQGQASIALGIQRESCIFKLFVEELEIGQVLRKSGRQGLWLVPGDKRTATAQVVLNAEKHNILTSATQAFVKPFTNGRPHFVIFDTAPSVGGFQESALYASDLVIIPSACDHLALFGVTDVLATLAMLRKRGWKGRAVALPTFYDTTTRHSKNQYRKLQDRLKAFGLEVLSPIHRATVMREAVAEGKTIFEYAPKDRAAQEYAALVWKVMELLR